MLKKIKISQFGGINTITDSSNLGVSEVRECKNFILRPLGGLSVPPSWASFTLNGTALDLGYINNVDLLFDTGKRLLLQSQDLNWWDVTPGDDGVPINTVLASAPSVILSANLLVAYGKVLAFKRSVSNFQRLTADQFAMGWATESLGSVPFYSTLYSSDQAFAYGYGPVFTDSATNKWRLFADNATGLNAVTIP